mgnify:CR=1 FL=1
MTPAEAQLKERLQRTRQAITDLAVSHNRPSSELKLLAVSKMQAANQFRMAFSFGQVAFGANYLPDALDKQPQLSALEIE